MTHNFDHIRPYTDEEVPSVLQDVIHDSFFPMVVNYLYPNADLTTLQKELSAIRSVKEFQSKVMHSAIGSVLQKTSTGLSSEGFSLLDNEKRHMFVANHRDIVLDAAILDVLLYDNGIDTCQITFGDNLMKGDLVVHIGKLNKMFKIVRGGNIRDFHKNSMEVSAYMRHVITEKHESVWIAQRNGRTKDGLDKTEIGLLKMFSLSSDKPFVDNFDEISITPVAISYEYEPCDFLKAVELYISQYQKYIKGEHEDLNSILIGIKQPKGHIHLAITPTILRNELIACDAKEKKNEKLEMLASIIDERINTHRKIYKTNYIAFDILHNSNHFAEFYTQNEKNEFVNYMKTGFDALEIKNDRCSIEEIFLKIYANALEKNDTIVHSAD